MIGHTSQPIQFDDVADIYDDYVRTDFDIPFWLSEAKSLTGKVLELACGTGRVSIPLLKAGVNLFCVDYAPRMLDKLSTKLEENGLSCPVICQDIAELALPDRFDLIFIPFHSFSEILQEHRRRAALERIRDHLTPQGTFICTLQNPAIHTSSMDGTMRPVGEFPMENGDTLVVNSQLDFDPSSQLASGKQTYDRLNPDSVLIDHRSLDVSFYLFRKLEFEAFSRDAGFEIAELFGDYDRTAFDGQSSKFMIWRLARSATGSRASQYKTSQMEKP
jgi:SAM-dependent methyltransferase